MPRNVREVEESLNKMISKVVEELGLIDAVVFVDGRAECVNCVRIQVSNEESFAKALAALLRQGISTGTLPIIVTKFVDRNSLRYSAVDYVNQVVVELSLTFA
ncbi:MAG: hypothetical protein DRO12_00660 [Thermoprotei archaeon]|nr:MAG: hypothetical protein DRO12_00660 [Thermoprotei archaeon]